MLFELMACLPPPRVVNIEPPEASVAEEIVGFLLQPLQPLREQYSAITGAGLENDTDEIETLKRRRLPMTEDGLSVSYLSVGDRRGRPVVFIHGSPGVAEEWGSFLVDVPQGQHRVAVDRPGFGETQPAEPMTSLADQARAIAPLLGRDDQPGAIVVGYSFGGPVALRLAADYPDRVAGLLLIGSAADPEEEEIHPLQEVAAVDLFAQLLPSELANSNVELMALKDELEALAPELGHIEAPVTIVQGLQDTLVPPESAYYLQEMLTGNARPRLVTIEGADHFLPWTHVDILKQALACVVIDAKRVAGQP